MGRKILNHRSQLVIRASGVIYSIRRTVRRISDVSQLSVSILKVAKPTNLMRSRLNSLLEKTGKEISFQMWATLASVAQSPSSKQVVDLWLNH